MRTLFVLLGIGSRGDIEPLIAMGRLLRAWEHDVLLVIPTGFEADLSTSGIEIVVAPADLTFSLDPPPPSRWSLAAHSRSVADWRRSGALIDRRTRWVHAFLRERHVPGRTVVIARSGLFGARIARETMCLRLATVHHSPAGLRSRMDSYRFQIPGGAAPHLRWMREAVWRAADAFVGNIVLPDLNRFRGDLGLSPVRRVFDRWAFSPDLNLSLFPSWFAPPQGDWPTATQLAGFPLDDAEPPPALPREVEEFLTKGVAPVVFTRGSHGDAGGAFFRAARDACARTGIRGILLGPDAHETTSSDDLIHLPFVSFRALLPRSRALVHHGGAGTVALAMQAGVPQIVVPVVGDQWDHGRRVEKLGLGLCLDPRVLSSRLAPALVDLLSRNETANLCASVARRLRDEVGIEAAALWLDTMALTRLRSPGVKDQVLTPDRSSPTAGKGV